MHLGPECSHYGFVGRETKIMAPDNRSHRVTLRTGRSRGWLRAGILACGLSVVSWVWAESTLTPVPTPFSAPEFALDDIDGKTWSLSALRGKVVVINFWATWCPPCREEMPAMQRAWEQLRERDVVMLAIDVGEDEDTVFLFTGQLPVELEFPLLLDSDGTVVEQWPVKGLPTTFVVDREGRVVYTAVGGRRWDDPALLAPILALTK